MISGRAIVMVLDSLGVGELPDAASYGDSGSNTLGNLAEAVGGLYLPAFESLGLGKILSLKGLSPDVAAEAAYGKMGEKSPGKDSITGHWELMGYIADRPQPLYPAGFPRRIIKALEGKTGLKFLGNYAASGTEIIQFLGDEHIRTANPIIYTSADSVLQIAAHEEVIPVQELYSICRIAREIMIGPDAIGRVIARPFIGESGNFQRTPNRRDFSLEAPGKTLLDLLCEANLSVCGIGKVEDLFAGRGISRAVHTESNLQGLQATKRAIEDGRDDFILVNLVDFDMLWGHRNDVQGYYDGLREVDRFLPQIKSALRRDDILFITADHGCDPTTPSTDHSREYVPILIYGDRVKGGVNVGVRDTFADMSATVADYFEIKGTGSGVSFKRMLMN